VKVAAILFVLLTTLAPAHVFDRGILEVEQFGRPRARPIIFIPGLACGRWVWDAQIRALAPKYALFVVTLPGFDGRDMIGGDDLMRRAVDSIHAIIALERLQRPVVVGHSLGGTLAVMFAQTYPNNASNIVSVEGGYPIAPTTATRKAAVRRNVAPYLGVTQAQLGRTLRTNLLQYTITRKADVDRVTQLAARSKPQAIVEWMNAALPLDLRSRMRAIRVPFTAIIPFDPQIDRYQGFPTKAAKVAAYTAWAKRTTDGKVILIDHARHFVMIDRPREFEAALESAITR
jgi:pimeloyl-ACP methyl ester carboxylesterase